MHYVMAADEKAREAEKCLTKSEKIATMLEAVAYITAAIKEVGATKELLELRNKYLLKNCEYIEEKT